MNLDFLLEILNRKLLETQNRPLKSTEILILRGIWQHQTYNQIAHEGGYSPAYLTNVVAPELCRRLSMFIGRRVTKKNCRVVLESYIVAPANPERILSREYSAGLSPDVYQSMSPCFPSGPISLDSPFYVEHSGTKEQIYEEIQKPGALVRIEGSKEMGKTSLLLRILDHAHRRGYRTVNLSLEQIDQTILSDVNRFLRWLSASVSHQLDLEPRLDECWDEDIGSKLSCTHYFQNYLLPQINSPVVLALDEVNQIFEYPHVAKDFFSLLRLWYEEAKRLPFWNQLRLVVVYSTEIYASLQVHKSPLNVGLPIQLNNFNPDQIQQLAQQYGLNWRYGREAMQIIAMVGGHPALVHIALYYLSRGKITLTQLLQTAATSTGIYSHHLQRHWAILQEQPDLAIALKTVIDANEPVVLEPNIAYKLNSMGLVKLENNKVIPSCQLYCLYFQSRFFPVERQTLIKQN
jgi:hypothetical protein